MLVQLFFLLLVFTKQNYSFSQSANSNPYQISAVFNSNPYQMSVAFNSKAQSFSQEKNSYLSIITSYGQVSSTHNKYSLSSTMAPTFVPSPKPSPKPSANPSANPSPKPSSKPSPKPSKKPTAMPTPPPSLLQFDTIITLSGFPKSKMNEQDQTTYIDALSMSTSIDSTYIKIIEQQLANRRLLYNIDVTTQITYPYVSNPEILYDSLTYKIKSSVEKGNFTHFLKNAANTSANAFNNIIISELLISPIVLLSMDPTAAPIPYYENTHPMYSILYICVFSISILILVRIKWMYDNKEFRCQKPQTIEVII